MNIKTLLLTLIALTAGLFTACNNRSEDYARMLPGSYTVSKTFDAPVEDGMGGTVIINSTDVYNQDGTSSSNGEVIVHYDSDDYGRLAKLKFNISQTGVWKIENGKLIETTKQCIVVPVNVKADDRDIYREFSNIIGDLAHEFQTDILSDPTGESKIISFEDGVITLEYDDEDLGIYTITMIKQ